MGQASQSIQGGPLNSLPVPSYRRSEQTMVAITGEVVGLEAMLRLVAENMSGESQSRCAQPEMAQARWYTRGFKWRS